MRNSFVFYTEWSEQLRLLDPVDRGALLLGLCEYVECGALPTLSGAAGMAFAFLRARIDRDGEKYEEQCTRNRQNGAKGGRPTKSTKPTKTDRNPPEPKKADTDVDTDPDVDTDSDVDPDPDIDVDPDPDPDIDVDPDPDIDVDPDLDVVSDVVSDADGGRKRAGEHPRTPLLRAAKEKRREYGVYGWIRLTAAQYDGLFSDLGGDELKRCVTYVDELAQSSGNKNRWSDWNLVLRRCAREGWGLRSGVRPSSSGTVVPFVTHDAEILRNFLADD